MGIKQIVEGHDTKTGRAFDLSIQALILLSLVSFCTETLPNVSPGVRVALHAIELVTVCIFAVEYLIRLAVADQRLGYALSFYGVVDLLAILPFFLNMGLDLLAIRIVRVARLLRIFKFLRYTRALDRFRRAAIEAREELLLYLAATCVLMFIASVGIYYCEHQAQPERFASVFDAMWWTVATFTTVGFGDIYPITVGGKVFTFVILMLGLGLVAVPSAILASALTKVRADERRSDSSYRE